MHVLFDLGATHSFIAKRIVTKLRKGVEKVEKGFLIGTPMGNMVEKNILYVDVGVSLSRYETEVDLIPLELHDFDIIIGMNWLSKYKALIDCYAKTVTFQTPKGERMIFERENSQTNCLNIGGNSPKTFKKGMYGIPRINLKL